ncbi:MAG: AI-2E family transporter [Chloroflexota bacterium]
MVERSTSGVPSSWLRALVLPLIILVWLVLLVLGLWVLSHFTRAILLFTLAAVLAFAFTPLANFFTRWMPRPLAIGLAYLLGLGVVFAFGAYIVATSVSQVTALITNLPAYAARAQVLQPQVNQVLAPLGFGSDLVGELQNQLIGQLQVFAGAVVHDLIPRLAEFFGTIIDLVLVIILSVYLCIDGTRISHWLKTQVPGRRTRLRAQLLVTVVNRVVGGYIRGVLTLAVLIGVLVGAGLTVLGVPYAVLLGVLAFFMEFIPVLGVFISGAAALIIAITEFRELTRPLIVLAYFVVVHVIEGDVIGPRIMGKAVGIHPATGLIALVAGTEVWGIWGALFAAPVAGLIQSILVAAWIEFRGGQPHEVLQSVATETAETAEEHIGAA